jgi:hypothetical protein
MSRASADCSLTGGGERGVVAEDSFAMSCCTTVLLATSRACGLVITQREATRAVARLSDGNASRQDGAAHGLPRRGVGSPWRLDRPSCSDAATLRRPGLVRMTLGYPLAGLQSRA